MAGLRKWKLSVLTSLVLLQTKRAASLHPRSSSRQNFFYSLEQSPKETLLYPRFFSLSNRLKHVLCTVLNLWDEEYGKKIWCASRSTYVVPMWGFRIVKQSVMGSLSLYENTWCTDWEYAKCLSVLSFLFSIKTFCGTSLWNLHYLNFSESSQPILN